MTPEDQILNHLATLIAGQARVEATLTATIKSYDQQFEAIAEDVKRRDNRQFWLTAAVVPFIAGLHEVAQRLGWTRH